MWTIGTLKKAVLSSNGKQSTRKVICYPLRYPIHVRTPPNGANP